MDPPPAEQCQHAQPLEGAQFADQRGQVGRGRRRRGGGQLVTVTGLFFEEGAVVRVDGVSRATTRLSETQLTYVSPAHAVGDAQITVVNPGMVTVSNSYTQSYVADPPAQITSVSPASASACGGGGRLYTVNGANFRTGYRVYIAGAFEVTTVQPVSQSQFAFYLDDCALAAGSYDLLVSTPDGQYSNPSAFTLTP